MAEVSLFQNMLGSPILDYPYRAITPLRDSIPRKGPEQHECPIPPKRGAYGVPAGNAVGTIRTSRRLGDRFAAYDSLPASVREALQQAVVDQCPMTIRSLYQPIADLVPDKGEAARLYLTCFDQAEQQEIVNHSWDYRWKHGMATGHVLARASVLRSHGLPKKARRRSSHR